MKFRGGNKGKPVRIRIDPDNIGAVSVEIDRVWYDAPALNGEELEGLSMAHWSRVMRELRQKYAAEAELTLPQRNRAIQKIRQLADSARDRGGLIDPEYTAGRLEYLEDNLCAGMLFTIRRRRQSAMVTFHSVKKSSRCIPQDRKTPPNNPNKTNPLTATSRSGHWRTDYDQIYKIVTRNSCETGQASRAFHATKMLCRYV